MYFKYQWVLEGPKADQHQNSNVEFHQTPKSDCFSRTCKWTFRYCISRTRLKFSLGVKHTSLLSTSQKTVFLRLALVVSLSLSSLFVKLEHFTQSASLHFLRLFYPPFLLPSPNFSILPFLCRRWLLFWAVVAKL